MLIKNAQNLMQAVIKTIAAAETAYVKVPYTTCIRATVLIAPSRVSKSQKVKRKVRPCL